MMPRAKIGVEDWGSIKVLRQASLFYVRWDATSSEPLSVIDRILQA